MRAAINTRYGTPDVLTVDETERPTIGPRDVLVRVHASAVTQGDRRLRAADFPGISGVFGRLLIGVFGPRHPIGGSMFAGRVVEVGRDVTRFAVGDDVYGSVMHGAYAEYLAVGAEEAIAKMPPNVGYGEAATLPYGAGTALVFLRDMAKVKPGERVLIVGASGGVGRMAVQVGRHLGADVTGVASRDGDRVRALGAARVIDYRAEDFTALGERWDVILDTTEGDHFRAFRRALSGRGRYLSLYLSLRLILEMAFTRLRKGPRAIGGVAQGNAQLLDELRGLVEADAIRPVVGARYPLARVVDAHTRLERDRCWGDVVIDVVEAPAPTLARVA